ncbi:hypothetical protein [Bradyrhizobium cytisi]|uniref:Uncharacterized protein n=1 Tax=Bradyrhizobium cytisi TaxID=515489 RepID=A0A5S4W544_9BRAD|nr:hypothetical protein [Bradyrhizobium cytisi]TYL75307.1 hypothetical protein FXB38_33175 [Bradyrhizobium cytisi]
MIEAIIERHAQMLWIAPTPGSMDELRRAGTHGLDSAAGPKLIEQKDGASQGSNAANRHGCNAKVSSR